MSIFFLKAETHPNNWKMVPTLGLFLEERFNIFQYRA